MKQLDNRTPEQIRETARSSYADAPDHVLESVIRVNVGTQLLEKEITREVAKELLAERRAS